MTIENGNPDNVPGTEGRQAARAEGAAGAQTRGGGKRRIAAALAVLATVGLGFGGYWFLFMRGIVYSDDARFSGHLVDVAPTVGGRLIAVHVHEGDAVRKGDPVFSLDPSVQEAVVTQEEAAVESAQASLVAAQARYARARNGPRREEIAAAEAELRKRESEASLATLELRRIEALRQEGAGTPDQLDRAKAACESAKQDRERAEQELAILRGGTRPDELEVAQADVRLARSRVTEAEAGLAKARRDLALYAVAAPVEGHVVRRWLDPGAAVQPGRPVISVFDPATLRVDANIEEKYLARVAVGDAVDIRVDAFPSRRLHGRVTDILRAANSTFSLVPAEGVAGTFIKVAQRVPLRIAVEAPPDLLLGPGLSVEVRIHRSSAQHRDGPEAAHD